ncbi:MAG: DedA family protein [Candidatus Gastranaerophilales bacterium]|nr:DedA family protein [Candidatus Gastranaerophilales bacterium]
MEFLHNMGAYFSGLGVLGLFLNSFIESFFLVPPPDFLLIAMDLKNINLALYYALICTVASAFGGSVGYIIGKLFGRPAFDWIFSGLQKRGNNKAKEYFDKVEILYGKYGSWAVFFAAFTPIPYKVFTIASGILNMNFLGFTIASVLGRGMRFFIVSVVLMFFGEKIKNNIEFVIIALSLLIILFFILLYKKRKTLVK